MKLCLILSVVILLLAKDFAGVRGQDSEEGLTTGLGEDTTTTTTTTTTATRARGCPYFFLCAAQNIPVLGGVFRKKIEFRRAKDNFKHGIKNTIGSTFNLFASIPGRIFGR